MRKFMSYILQSFKDTTGWNRENVYSEINETADELLNFQTPGGLRLNLSSLATPQFATCYGLGTVGVVDGSISYLYSSVPLVNVAAQSEAIPLTTLFRSYRQLRELPHRDAVLGSLRPPPQWAALGFGRIMQDAQLLVEKPTLLYGRLYLPQSMLEALVIKRVSPSVQLQLRAVSEGQLRNGGTLLGMVQIDRGQYGLEGLASTDGGLLGLRGLYNFGGDASSPRRQPGGQAAASGHEDSGNGHGGERESIYGRFSVGGEIYYGTLNKSGGISMGARFATLPTHRGTPLTATLTINPLMGNISANFAVLAGDHCSLATKFDFNVYSYESQWAVGTELWSKRQLAGLVGVDETPRKPATDVPKWKERSFQAKLEWRLDEQKQVQSSHNPRVDGDTGKDRTTADEYHGVLKARLDQHLKIGLLWEGRLKSLLFSLGTGIDLHKLDQPFRTLGLDIQFST